MENRKIDNSQWVDQYGDLMYRYTLVRVKDPNSAEEIVQMTFFSALQSQATFAGRSSEKSWLFGILKHKILDHYREMSKSRKMDLLDEDGSDSPDNQFDSSGHWKKMPVRWSEDPEKAAENSQLAKALSHCIDGLSEKFRSIFVLKEIDGLSSEDICKEFNIKPTNLWVMLHRSRTQLKKCLESNWLLDEGNHQKRL
jgi:RNA polymerase sigma-70 factor (ECF subfamily)